MTFLGFFSCRLLTTPIFTRRLSSVLSKFSHKKTNFRSGVTQGGNAPPPSSALVTPLYKREQETHQEMR